MLWLEPPQRDGLWLEQHFTPTSRYHIPESHSHSLTFWANSPFISIIIISAESPTALGKKKKKKAFVVSGRCLNCPTDGNSRGSATALPSRAQPRAQHPRPGGFVVGCQPRTAPGLDNTGTTARGCPPGRRGAPSHRLRYEKGAGKSPAGRPAPPAVLAPGGGGCSPAPAGCQQHGHEVAHRGRGRTFCTALNPPLHPCSRDPRPCPQTGRLQAARPPLPGATPPTCLQVCRVWGFLQPLDFRCALEEDRYYYLGVCFSLERKAPRYNRGVPRQSPSRLEATR